MRSMSPDPQRAVRYPFITTNLEDTRKENSTMRKLTTIVAFVLTLSIVAPVTTFAANAPSPKTKSTNVREDSGPRDPDLITRVLKFIKAHLPVHSMDDAPLPTIPNP